MNRVILKQLRDFEVDKTLAMEDFTSECGTAGCHAGWLCMMCGVSPAPRAHFNPWDYAKMTAGLNEDQATFLFGAETFRWDSPAVCDESEARVRLDILIEESWISFDLAIESLARRVKTVEAAC